MKSVSVEDFIGMESVGLMRGKKNIQTLPQVPNAQSSSQPELSQQKFGVTTSASTYDNNFISKTLEYTNQAILDSNISASLSNSRVPKRSREEIENLALLQGAKGG